MDEQNTSAGAAQKRQRRVEMILRIMALYRQRLNINGLRLFADANTHLDKPDRFEGEQEFLALMDELLTTGEVGLRKFSGNRAEDHWFADPSVVPHPSQQYI
jgi:hypothetical protein